MVFLRRSLQIKIFKFIDVATITFCFGLTFFMSRENAPFSYLLSRRIEIKQLFWFVTFILVWHVIFLSGGLYHSKRVSVKLKEYADILKCTSFGSLIMLLAGYFIGIEFLDESFMVAFWSGSSLSMILGRIILRNILAAVRSRGINQKMVLIVGAGKRAHGLAGMIQRKRELGYKIIGCIDDDGVCLGESELPGPLLGNLEDISRILSDYVVDEVFISLPIKSYYEKIEEIIGHCESQGVIVRISTDLFAMRLAKSQLDFLEDIALISLHSAPYRGSEVAAKRAIDLLFSTALLILFSPVFLAVAILIKWKTPGPVFFLQDRVGLNKRVFKIIKFRTMVENAQELLPALEGLNEMHGATFKMKDDPRLTKVGKILRKNSVDELPQLINILKGDMSLVGPRPLPLRDYRGFNADWQKRRFSVKPGLTCLWQINGRSHVDFSKWMELDMEYIDHWSLQLDFKILLKTIPVVIIRKGAV
jgi:exopolysaccharide biosynthesis polyprenyl glycosylphosphotransferase